MNKFDVIIVGGGAGGFFAAINIAERFPEKKIIILEKAKEGLLKLKVSGGGRCNITNAMPLVQDFVKNYPRGEKELLSPMLSFGNSQTMEWFVGRGVPLSTEADGRVFPKANTSQAVIDCFLRLVQKYGIEVAYNQGVMQISQEFGLWQVRTATDTFSAPKLVIATGSNEKMWQLLAQLGHSIVLGVPSLFSFSTNDDFIQGLAGTSLQVGLQLQLPQGIGLKNKYLKSANVGSMLITHSGFSGPAVLRLSAFAARELHASDYQATLLINWLAGASVRNEEEAVAFIVAHKREHLYKEMGNAPLSGLTKKLWLKILERIKIENNILWHDFSYTQVRLLSAWLVCSAFPIVGKATNKEEFVTAGGVSLKEVSMKDFSSKLFDNLYFTGEVLNVDALTGGYNFQNAWSGAYAISKHIF